MMSLICVLGILVYILVISNEHILVFVLIGVVLSSSISCVVFVMLNVCGNCMYCVKIFDVCVASWYAGAFFQFTIGLILMGFLCILIVAHIVGAFVLGLSNLWF
jgi:hypothetical protein